VVVDSSTFRRCRGSFPGKSWDKVDFLDIQSYLLRFGVLGGPSTEPQQVALDVEG